ncbi:MAG: hypothetical protein IJJ26_12645 [Victivallales bacterium]|nr:hypothetical protein [Victivallales bacterium]
MKTRRFLSFSILLLVYGSILSHTSLAQAEDAAIQAALGIRTAQQGRFLPIDLRQAANSTFSDEIAEDDKGGWTDQGSANDLRMFEPGLVTKCGVPFQTIAPKTNGGRAIIGLAGPDREKTFVPVEQTLELPQSDLTTLHLVHTSAWTPSAKKKVGTMFVTYQDGDTGEIPVISGIDCVDWWFHGSKPNAGVFWLTEGTERRVALYASSFSLGKPAKSITFRVAKGFWLIVAATLGERHVSFQEVEVPLTLQEGPDWAVLDFNRDTIPGSPLDFSGTNHTPAGKYGWMIADKDGHFVFENAPDKRIRLHGTNLCFNANTLEHADADALVRRLVSTGYNSLRFHHMEREICKPKPAKSTDLRPEQVDKFHYLVNACKQAGLYITLDLYCSRALSPADGITSIDEFTRFEMKSLAPVDKSAMENWKEYTRVLLLTPNKYTGLPLAQDPCVAFLNLMNEDGTIACHTQFPKIKAIYDRLWDEYKAQNRIDETKYPGAHNKWLSDLQIKCIQEMTRFLREEIKTKALITDLNWLNSISHSIGRDYLDVVDNHHYHDHPSFIGKNWALPYGFHQSSAIKNSAILPRDLMGARLFGKPYTVTEWNYCNPNVNRSQQAALVGGYAALQDWDGLYRFAWSHNSQSIVENSPAIRFDSANDPAAQLADRIIWALFVRGDVQSAKGAVAARILEEKMLGRNSNMQISGDFTLLGLLTRIGSLNNQKQFQNIPEVPFQNPNWTESLPKELSQFLKDFKQNRKATSSTGEIFLDSLADLIAIDTPRSQVLACSDDAQGGLLSVKNIHHPQSFALISLDGLPVQSSKRMLFLHIANIGNTGMTFRNQMRTVLTDWGQRPLLVQKADVLVNIKMPTAKVQALALDGSLNGDVEASFQNGVLQFHANNAARKGGTLCYLLTR